MATYSIRDLENLSGIKAHTLRIWEKRYDLIKPRRTITNIRYYDGNDLKRILNIAMLNHNGTKISRIAVMDEQEIFERINNLAWNPPEVSGILENLVTVMVSMDENKFREIFNECVARYGFGKTILDIVYPFFEKVGTLWLTGVIIPAQEHFITNLIRQQICVAINDLNTESKAGAKDFIIYLPEGELHELGLMFFHYLARSYGHKVMYLGQSVPFEDLKTVHRMHNADYVVTSFSSSVSGIDIDNYLLELAEMFHDSTVLFLVYNNYRHVHNLPSNALRVKNALHYAELIKSV